MYFILQKLFLNTKSSNTLNRSSSQGQMDETQIENVDPKRRMIKLKNKFNVKALILLIPVEFREDPTFSNHRLL